MANPLLINSINASTAYGFTLGQAPGWADAPTQAYTTATIPGRQGVTALAAPSEGTRRLTLQGYVQGKTQADFLAKLDALKLALLTNPLTIVLPDRPTRFYVVSFVSLAVTPTNSASMIVPGLAVTIALDAQDPYSYDTTATTVTKAVSVAAPLPLGTAPVRPLIQVTGPSNPISLGLYDSSGASVATMAFTSAVFPSSGQVVTIDCDAQTVTLPSGLTGLPYLSSGDFFTVDPATMANYTASAWPSIKLFGGGTVTVSYRKAWR